MSEDDRIELMVLVKEGKLTMEQAVDTVSQFVMTSMLSVINLFCTSLGFNSIIINL